MGIEKSKILIVPGVGKHVTTMRLASNWCQMRQMVEFLPLGYEPCYWLAGMRYCSSVFFDPFTNPDYNFQMANEIAKSSILGLSGFHPICHDFTPKFCMF